MDPSETMQETVHVFAIISHSPEMRWKNFSPSSLPGVKVKKKSLLNPSQNDFFRA